MYGRLSGKAERHPNEEKELGADMFLKVLPGESVTISSFEQFDFTKEAIGKVFPGCDLMALITPTTTMMREGIAQQLECPLRLLPILADRGNFLSRSDVPSCHPF